MIIATRILIFVVNCLTWIWITGTADAQLASGRPRTTPVYDSAGNYIGFRYFGSTDGGRLPLVPPAPGNAEGTLFVHLGGYTITAPETASLRAFENLEELSIGDFPDAVALSADAFTELCKITSLRQLSMHIEDPPRLNWNDLRALRRLEDLEIGGATDFNSSDIATICQLPSLKHLSLGYRIDCQDYDWLGSCGRLRTLVLHLGDKSSPAPMDLTQLRGLHQFDCKGRALTASELDQLAENCANSMTHLDVELVDAGAFGKLKEFPHLQVLIVDVNSSEACDLASIAKLKRLTFLRLNSCRIDDLEFAKLRDHPSLERIVLTNAHLTHASLDVFHSLVSLRDVSLSGSESTKWVSSVVDSLLREKRTKRKD